MHRSGFPFDTPRANAKGKRIEEPPVWDSALIRRYRAETMGFVSGE